MQQSTRKNITMTEKTFRSLASMAALHGLRVGELLDVILNFHGDSIQETLTALDKRQAQS